MCCGPYRVVSLMSREAADSLGLDPGVVAVASIKATNVVVEVPAMKRPGIRPSAALLLSLAARRLQWR